MKSQKYPRRGDENNKDSSEERTFTSILFQVVNKMKNHKAGNDIPYKKGKIIFLK